MAVSVSADQYKIDIAEGRNTAQFTVTAVYADGTSRDVTADCTVTVDRDVAAIGDGQIRG